MRWHPGGGEQVARGQCPSDGDDQRSDDAAVEAVRHEHRKVPERNSNHHPYEHAHSGSPGRMAFETESSMRTDCAVTGSRTMGATVYWRARPMPTSSRGSSGSVRASVKRLAAGGE